MIWAIGYDEKWKRDIGYGVPSICDQPDCGEKIHRGLVYVCGGEPYGGEHGCGLFFCDKHLYTGLVQLCYHCQEDDGGRQEPTADTTEWMKHKLLDDSWAEWRKQNPSEVGNMLERVLS